MASGRRSAARPRSRRCGPGSSRGWRRRRASGSACSRRRCTRGRPRVRWPPGSTTSSTATTAPTRPGRAGTPAPASARPTVPSCSTCSAAPPAPPAAETRYAPVAHRAKTVVALWATGANLLARWATGPIRRWPGGPPGPNRSGPRGPLLLGRAALEDVVAWVVRREHGRGLGGDAAEAALLVVLEGPGQLGLGVHHERAVSRDRLADRLAAEQEDVERGARAVHLRVGSERDRLAEAEDRELARADGTPIDANRARAREHVAERVEVRAPWETDLRARRDRGVHQRDRGVRDTGARVPVELAGDDAQQRAAVLRGEQRDLAGPDVLIAGRRHLQPGGQVDPELEAVEPAAAHHQFLRRRLD